MGACKVHGLAKFLAHLNLGEYYHSAVEWCNRMGACCIEELTEYHEEFAEGLGLKPLEKRRLAKACKEPETLQVFMKPAAGSAWTSQQFERTGEVRRATPNSSWKGKGRSKVGYNADGMWERFNSNATPREDSNVAPQMLKDLARRRRPRF